MRVLSPEGWGWLALATVMGINALLGITFMLDQAHVSIWITEHSQITYAHLGVLLIVVALTSAFGYMAGGLETLSLFIIPSCFVSILIVWRIVTMRDIPLEHALGYVNNIVIQFVMVATSLRIQYMSDFIQRHWRDELLSE